jgi:hypothetical protein
MLEPKTLARNRTESSSMRKQQRRLALLHSEFRQWFGAHSDLDVIDANLAAVAVEKLDGEPLWTLTVAAASTAKTETLRTLTECPGVVEVSTFTSDAGLLSGTPRDQSADDADGGIMRKLEPRGIMLIKDVTSILSLGPIERAKILAALREVYDGYWYRQSGGEGGKRLEWRGRIALVGAVTDQWDRHYAAISQMGDRFVLIRMDSRNHRIASGLQGLANSGQEQQYRAKLSAMCWDLVNAIETDWARTLGAKAEAKLVAAANLTTWARSAVEFDRYRGEVVDVNDPEGPARFAKQLGQLVRGAYLIGLPGADAMRLAIRCARDSIPPLRLAVLEDVAKNQDSTIAEVTRRIEKPRSTVARQLASLDALDLLTCVDQRYRTATGINISVLTLPKRSVRDNQQYGEDPI